MAAPVVLLIDDDVEFSETIKANLSTRGIPIDHASNWKDGMDLFHVGLHELVIADYNLPGSNHGLKLLAEIRPLRPSTELILISGAITSVPEDKIKSSGLVSEYFPKDSRLVPKLAAKATEAARRAQSGTEWHAVAQGHVEGGQIDVSVVDEIDRLLRGDIPKR